MTSQAVQTPIPRARSESEALSVRGLSRSFAGVRALHGVDFTVHRGNVCGIIGPNGAGKSTLLNIINGVYRADAGEVWLFGTQLDGGPQRAAELGIGRTFQHIALFKGLSVLDNLVAGQRLSRRSGIHASSKNQYLLGGGEYTYGLVTARFNASYGRYVDTHTHERFFVPALGIKPIAQLLLLAEYVHWQHFQNGQSSFIDRSLNVTAHGFF